MTHSTPDINFPSVALVWIGFVLLEPVAFAQTPENSSPQSFRSQHVTAERTPQTAEGDTSDTILLAREGMELRLIPAGQFQMGSPVEETGRDHDEPQHTVVLTQPFYLQTTEVTQGQWKAVMKTEPWRGKPFVQEGPDYPASYINWHDAVSFCRELTRQEGHHRFRLPTEAEWEYACRAGRSAAWCFGDDEDTLNRYAWWGGFVKGGNCRIEQYAHPVGQKQANAFQLFDMHGNVREWCADWYGDYRTDQIRTDPIGARSSSDRVLRGGSWYFRRADTRSANRFPGIPNRRCYYIGFRVACDAE